MSSSLHDHLALTLGARYRIEREFGGGGMARVFLAEERALGRRVVIKVLPPELAGGVSVERFRREIQLAAHLQHPHIVPVLSAGDAGGDPVLGDGPIEPGAPSEREGERLLYYTMPYVDGESLRARLARPGGVPTEAALPILRDVLRALAYAHRHGVVHRDIKPENILLAEDSAVVADFGIAKAIEGAREADPSASVRPSHAASLTTVGVSLGTPAYMAPEQIVGDPTADHRVDLYAFGAVAYEMLAGRPVFSGLTAQQLLAAHLARTPEPLADLRPELPSALAAVIMRCLEKTPDDRPRSADDVFHALDAGGPPALAPAAGLRRRHRRRAVLASVGLAVLLLGSGTVAFMPKDARAMAIALIRRKPAALRSNRYLVAPFENRTGDPALDPVGHMAADWIAEGLSRLSGIEVVDARSTLVSERIIDRIPWPLRARGREHAMAEETGAGVLVAGAFYKDGDSLRFDGRIRDVVTGTILQALTPVAGPVRAPTAVIEDLRRRVVGLVAQASDTVVTAALGHYSDPPSIDAYEEMRQAIEAYFRGDDAALFRHLDRAASLDTSYVTPLVFQSFADYYRFRFPRVDADVRRAERLRDRMTPAEHAMLAHVRARMHADGAGALRWAQEFMRATPGSMESPLLVAGQALAMRQPRVALAALGRTDPDRGLNLVGPFYWIYATEAHHQLGDHRRALEAARDGERRFPSYTGFSYSEVRELIDLGEFDDVATAIARVPGQRRVSALVGRMILAARATTLLRRAGRDAQARQLARTWIQQGAALAGDTTRLAMSARMTLFAVTDSWDSVRVLAERRLATDTGWGRLAALTVADVADIHLRGAATTSRADSALRALRDPYAFGHDAQMRAYLAAHRGERAAAVQLLRQALADGLGSTTVSDPYVADPWLLPLRGDAEFEALLKGRR